MVFKVAAFGSICQSKLQRSLYVQKEYGPNNGREGNKVWYTLLKMLVSMSFIQFTWSLGLAASLKKKNYFQKIGLLSFCVPNPTCVSHYQHKLSNPLSLASTSINIVSLTTQICNLKIHSNLPYYSNCNLILL